MGKVIDQERFIQRGEHRRAKKRRDNQFSYRHSSRTDKCTIQEQAGKVSCSQIYTMPRFTLKRQVHDKYYNWEQSMED